VTIAEVRIGDILRLARVPVQVDPLGCYRQIGVRSFGKGLIRYPEVSGTELGRLRYFVLPVDALILSNIKAWEGAIAISGRCDGDFVASNRFLGYLPVDRNWVDVRYVRYFFLSDRGLPLIQQASPGAADRNRTLGIAAFEDIRIPLPNIAEQSRIVGRLDATYSKTEQIRRATRRNAELVDALTSSLVSDSASHVRLGDALSLDISVVGVKPDSVFQLAGVFGFGRGLFSRGYLSGADTGYGRLHHLRAGQVVMSRLKAFEGAIAVVPREFDGFVLSPEFPTFSPNPELVHPGYLEMLCRWQGTVQLLRTASRGMGARRERVSAEAFLEIEVPLPDIERQRHLAGIYSRGHQTVHADWRRRELLEALERSTLNQAFGGAR